MSSISNTLPVSALLQSTTAPKIQVPELGLLPNTANSSAAQTPFRVGSSVQTGSSSDMMNMMAGMMSSMFQMFMQQMMSGAGNPASNNLLAASSGLSASPLVGNSGFSSSSLTGMVPSMTSSLLNLGSLTSPSSSSSIMGLFPSSSAGLANSSAGLATSLPLSSTNAASAGSLGSLGSISTPGIVANGGVQGSGAGARAIGYDPEGATEKPGIVAASNSANQLQGAKNASNALGQQISNISAGLGTTSAVPSSLLSSSLSLPSASATPASAPAASAAITSAGSATATKAATVATPTAGLAAAASPSTASSSLSSLITSIIDVCKQLITALGGTSATAASTSAGTAAKTTAATGTAPAATTAATTAAPRTQFNQEDAKNYILGSSRGGTIVQEPSISSNFSDKTSRFYKIGDTNEFDAVVQKIYSAQFAGYAKGLDIVYNPGTDNIDTIAGNIVKAQDAYNGLNDDARLFADVAATYRGDFGNRGAYNNPALKQLLTSWGRTDLANAQFVGDPSADAQTIGAVTQALNEQADPATRKAWMQQIFDFQNNTASSPSGAVPDVADYQKAIAIVKGGTLEKLMQNYVNGIKTTGPIA